MQGLAAADPALHKPSGSLQRAPADFRVSRAVHETPSIFAPVATPVTQPHDHTTTGAGIGASAGPADVHVNVDGEGGRPGGTCETQPGCASVSSAHKAHPSRAATTAGVAAGRRATKRISPCGMCGGRHEQCWVRETSVHVKIRSAVLLRFRRHNQHAAAVHASRPARRSMLCRACAAL